MGVGGGGVICGCFQPTRKLCKNSWHTEYNRLSSLCREQWVAAVFAAVNARRVHVYSL